MKKSVAALPRVYLMILIYALLMIIQTYPVTVYAAEEISVHTSQGDTVSLFGDININKVTVGDVVVIFGNVEVQSEVQGDVVAIFGNIKIDARVSGDVCGLFGNVVLTDSASIGGDIFALGTMQKAHGAKLGGQEVKVNTGVLTVARAALTVVLSVFALILGLAMIAIFRDRFRRISIHVDECIGRKLLMGFLGLIGATILMILLTITVVAPLLYLILLLGAEIAASVYFGRQILKVLDLKFGIYFEFITGLLFITLIKVALTMAVPQYNFLAYILLYLSFSLLVNSLGMGILVHSKFGSMNSTRGIPGQGDRNAPITGYDGNMNFDHLNMDLKLEGGKNDSQT